MTEPDENNVQPSPDVGDEAPPPLESDRLPVSLRVIAWVWLILGVSSLANVIVNWFIVGHGPILDLGVLGIFIGRGLLLRRQRWLAIASGCGLFLLGVLLLFVIPAAITFALARSTRVIWSVPPPLLILSLLGTTAYLIWYWRVLGRPEVREIYRRAAAAPPQQGPKRFQFSLGTLLMLAVMAAFVLPQFMSDDVLYEHHQRFTRGGLSPGGKQWQVYCGYRSHRFLSNRDKVEYVVFLSGTGWEMGRRLTTRTGIRDYLKTPDGTTIALPTDCQLIECIDGRYRESPERVTKTQLDAFLASNPAEYTIDALVEFAEGHPE